MKVCELIKELEKMPQDATAIINNDSTWIDGEYEVTSVESYDYNSTVGICSDYENLVEE